MGVCNFIVVIASRASSKSFMIALFACCKAILYPNSKIIISSATKGQSKLLVSEKIEKELKVWSKNLDKEILRIKDNQNEIIVYFKNNSTIRVVPASENARGNRSTCLIREECRQIPKNIDDSVLSPMQFLRSPPYMKDSYYSEISELREEAIDVYISSSWFDNGSDDTWMWKVVDNACNSMLNDKPFMLLGFDESVALCHNLKSQIALQNERKKQDPITWKLEFLNCRLKENMSAFFTYSMLQKNQRAKQPFYPRTTIDFKIGRKNPYDIPKQPNEIRIVACDMAFVENKKNDNSIFSCMRLLPESTTYKRENSSDITVDNGYRRILSYLESVQGGDTTRQAIRIRELFSDFHADYIVLDLRNAGIAIYDSLSKVLYDEERGIEYSALSCMNDESIANRNKVQGSVPCIFVINATQKLNSDIAIEFRQALEEEKIDFLVSFEQAKEIILPNIKEYNEAIDGETQAIYESPFLETQSLFSETAGLLYEKKADTGVITVREPSGARKDRYTSVSYANHMVCMLERDLIANSSEYEFGVFIN